MGISYETYVGPYVRCEIQMVDVTKTKRACPNQACKVYGRERVTQDTFCAQCGSSISDIPYIERKEAVDKWEVSEEIDEHFSCPGGDGYYRWVEESNIHLWLPNIDAGIPRDGHLESQEDFKQVDIQVADIQTEIEQFTTFFAKELAHVRTRYGEAAVSVRWGIIQHYY